MEQQRMGRAGFIHDQPGLWLAMTYAVAFLGVSVAGDLWNRFIPPLAHESGAWRYFIPLSIAIPQWIGLRSWARRVLEARPPQAEP